jgi:GTP-binding protein HflX
LARRKVPFDPFLPYDLARTLTTLSHEISRQIGLLISREGEIYSILIGSNRGILIPDLSQFRPPTKGLRGIRLLHTHLKNEPLSEDDLTDLALLRLDLMVAVGVLPDGLPDQVYVAHLVPPNPGEKLYEVHPPLSIHQLHLMDTAFLKTIFMEADVRSSTKKAAKEKLQAILISASTKNRIDQEESLDELAELARSAQLNPIERFIQRVKIFHPKYLLGSGKVKEIVMKALQLQADLLIFDQNLTPLQIKAIGEVTEMRVIDRTQLILDIFAQRAVTRDAQVQVELAQLRYRLPRLAERSTALSRLTGGIGGRGPGETRLEVDRRRARDRIARLEKEMEILARGRSQRRTKRVEQSTPILSIVGYTNAGKSTLLNALTKSELKAENLLFSTLDTATRRLRFPREREVVLTDTVGFIQSIPRELLGAFQSTMDELKDAHLLIHLVDIHFPRFEQQMSAVHEILNEIGVGDKPELLVFNKIDLIEPKMRDILCDRYGAIGISALSPDTLPSLLTAIEKRLWETASIHMNIQAGAK